MGNYVITSKIFKEMVIKIIHVGSKSNDMRKCHEKEAEGDLTEEKEEAIYPQRQR